MKIVGYTILVLFGLMATSCMTPTDRKLYEEAFGPSVKEADQAPAKSADIVKSDAAAPASEAAKAEPEDDSEL